MDFVASVNRFEQEVICKGVEVEKFIKKSHVPVKSCKLSLTPFGFEMGVFVDTEAILTVDYYGYLKKSRGFLEKFADKNKDDVIWSPIVHFASIKIEDIVQMTIDMSVIATFPLLKNEILIRRGFKAR